MPNPAELDPSADDSLSARVRRYWAAAVARDWPAFGACVHPDVVYRVPQTREIVRGREGYVEFNATYPGAWTAEIVSVTEAPGLAVSRILFTVGGETVTGISCFEFDADGLITVIDDFWPEPYEPPVRVTAAVQRY